MGVRTLDFGRLYLTLMPYPVKQFEGAISQETEPPYRVGRGIATRLAPSVAFVVGWWGPEPESKESEEPTSEAQHVSQGRVLDVRPEEISQW